METFPLTWATLAYFGSALMAASAVLMWIYKELNALRQDLAEFRIKVAQEYVSIIALRTMEDRLNASVNRLIDRVDRAIELAMGLKTAKVDEVPLT